MKKLRTRTSGTFGVLEYRIGSSKIPLRATRFPLKHASNGWSMPTLLCNWICKWLQQNNKSGIQFDIKTPPAPYAFNTVQIYPYNTPKPFTISCTCLLYRSQDHEDS